MVFMSFTKKKIIKLPLEFQNCFTKLTSISWCCPQLTVACIKMNRVEIAEKAVKLAERRISGDKWPEYYDSKRGRFIGKQSRLYQTWSIAGYLVAKLLLDNPAAAKVLVTEEDSELVNAFSCMISASPRRRKRGRKKQTFIV